MSLNADRPLTTREEVMQFVDDCKYASAQPTITREDKAKIASVFFNQLAKLPETLFDRRLIQKNSSLEKLLAEELQQQTGHAKSLITLRHEYEQLCLARQEALSPSEKATIGDTLLDLIEKEALLALKLGIQPKAAGEASTAFFLRDLQGKKIAIFKPDELGPRAKNNPKLSSRIKTFFAKHIFGFRSIRQARQRVGEEFTYLASKSIGVMTVPPTKITAIQANLLLPNMDKVLRGSLQVFVEGITPAGEVLHKKAPKTLDIIIKYFQKIIYGIIATVTKAPLRTKESAGTLSAEETAISTRLLLPFAAVDFITGQIDRHWNNWMLSLPKTTASKESAEKASADNGRIGISVQRLFACDNGKCIVAIDNGACASVNYPGEIEDRNQYLWSELDLSNIIVADEWQKLKPEPEPDWQQKIMHNLLQTGLAEDAPDSEESQKKKLEEQIMQIVKSVQRSPPSLEGIKQILSKKITDPKLLRRISKLTSQLCAMKERLAVFEIFTDPPEKHRDYFTLKALGQIRTRADFQRFWKIVDTMY